MIIDASQTNQAMVFTGIYIYVIILEKLKERLNTY